MDTTPSAGAFRASATPPAPPTLIPRASKIGDARAEGYSDNEILRHLASREPAFQVARDEGYSPTEILDHLSQPQPASAAPTPDTARVKRNIGKMIDQGAPEADIDAYVASEGVTAEALRGVAQSAPHPAFGSPPSSAPSASTGAGTTTLAQSLQKGVADIPRAVGKTIKNYVDPVTGAALEQRGAAMAPTGHQSAFDRVLHPQAGDVTVGGFGIGSLPHAAAEALPGLGVDVAAAKLGKGIGGVRGAVVGGLLSAGLRAAGEAAEGRAQARTGDPAAQPNAGDKAAGAGIAAVQAALNQVALNRFINPARMTAAGSHGVAQAGAELVRKAGMEAATEAAQDVVGQAGTTVGTPGGLKVDPRQTLAAGMVGGVAGGAFGTPRALADVNTARRFRGIDPEAGSTVAARLQDNAQGESLADPTVAAKAMRRTTTDLHSDAEWLLGIAPELKDRITSSPAANRAWERLKGGENAVTKADLAALDSAVESSPNGHTVSSLAREFETMRVLKRFGVLSEGSFKGGAAAAMERHTRPIRNPIGAGAASGLGAAGMSSDVAFLHPIGTGAIAALAGLYTTARAFDRYAGYRSPANTFAHTFGREHVPVPVPRLMDEKRQGRPTGPKVPQGATRLPWEFPGAPSGALSPKRR